MTPIVQARRDQWTSLLRAQLRVCGIAAPELREEVRFHPKRRWRFDFACPHVKVGIEVEGGVFVRVVASRWESVGGKLVRRTSKASRHTTGVGYSKDCSKYNAAQMLGWIVLRFTSPMIVSGEAARTIVEAVRAREAALRGSAATVAEAR